MIQALVIYSEKPDTRSSYFRLDSGIIMNYPIYYKQSLYL